MDQSQSDSLVFFGATGDLAYKKIFPALQSMVLRRSLNVPVIGVAKAGWNLAPLKARAQDSLEKHGGLDNEAWQKLSTLLGYVDGDYAEPDTFAKVRRCARDVVQSHIFQVMCNLTMESPPRGDSESLRDEMAKVLKAIPAIDPKNLIRGQFRGYRDERGVAPESQIETFAAVCLEIKSWRWDGVPFYIRTSKNLPVTCMEILARFRNPPATNMTELGTPQNYMRFRISPEITVAMEVSVSPPCGMGRRDAVEMIASAIPGQKRWRRMKEFWVTRWLAIQPSSPDRTTSRRLGESLTEH